MAERADDFDADAFEVDEPDLAAVLDLAEIATLRDDVTFRDDVALRDDAGRVAEAFVLDAALLDATVFDDTVLDGAAVLEAIVFGFGAFDAETLDAEIFDAVDFDPGVLEEEGLETLASTPETLAKTLAVVALDAAALAVAVLGGIWAHSLADPLWRRAGSARRRHASVEALALD